MASMKGGHVPPGVRFKPTDEELVIYYLKRKIMGKRLHIKIAEIDLYKFAPWDLPEKSCLQSCLQSRDLEWYFFCLRYRKYANGSKTNRATENGFWKITGNDIPVCHNSHTIGMRKTLVFHEGRAPKGKRTDWVMHEYRLTDQSLLATAISQDTYVVCKIFQKSGPGPKNGEQHGAPFNEEVWNDDEEDCLITLPFVDTRSPSLLPVNDENVAMSENTCYTGCTLSQPCAQKSGTAYDGDHPTLPESDDVRKMLLEIMENDAGTSVFQEHGIDEETFGANFIANDGVPLDGDDIFNGLEDINSDADQNFTEKYKFSFDQEGQQVRQEMLSGVHGGYMELKDLQDPIEAGGFDFGFTNGLFDHFDNLPGVAIPGAEINTSGISTNLESREPMQSSTDHSVQNAAVESEHVPLDSATQQIQVLRPLVCGEGRGAGDPSDAALSSLLPISNSRVPYSALQYLLGSIPARPASAAEYPTPVKSEKSEDAFLSYEGPICVKAEADQEACGGPFSPWQGIQICASFGGGNSHIVDFSLLCTIFI